MTATTVRLNTANFPMQFSDDPKRVRSDMAKIFDRADEKEYDWWTGTEAGQGKFPAVRDALLAEAEDHGVRVSVRGDTWVAVPGRVIVLGSYSKGAEFAFSHDQGVGKHGDKYLTWASWEHDEVGRMAAGAVHYARYGRPGAASPEYKQNLKWNKIYAEVCGKWGHEHGKGRAKCFISGDFNIVDKVDDVFMGAPFTTVADELKKYENTGHGPIDGIASYDPDKRVSAAYWRALDDKEFHLFTDHFATEAGFDVRV